MMDDRERGAFLSALETLMTTADFEDWEHDDLCEGFERKECSCRFGIIASSLRDLAAVALDMPESLLNGTRHDQIRRVLQNIDEADAALKA